MTECFSGARRAHASAHLATYGALAGLVAMLMLAAVAAAHQTTTSRGVAVTLHVNPDDEPIAGEPTSIRLVRIKVPGTGSKFKYSTCGCRLKVVSASGTPVIDQAAGQLTNLTFPDTGAYEITYSGSYRTKTKKKKTFSAKFAVRAVAPE